MNNNLNDCHKINSNFFDINNNNISRNLLSIEELEKQYYTSLKILTEFNKNTTILQIDIYKTLGYFDK